MANSGGDTVPPSAPGNVLGLAGGQTSASIEWSASTDNVGVDHYEIIRDGTTFGRVPKTPFVDKAAGSATTHSYRVVAVDAAGNVSTPSATVSVRTPNLPAGFPTAGNTGVPAGTTLTVVNGDLRVTAANAVIDAKDIRGCVLIDAPGVTIKRSKVRCTGNYAIYTHLGTSAGAPLTIVDSEISCEDSSGNATGATGIGDTNFVATRLNIHDCENGFDLDTDATITDSYIHDLLIDARAHTDGIQFSIGRRIVIRHNAIYINGTSAIIQNGQTVADILIEANLLAGGAYTLYCPRDGSSNERIIANRFSRAMYPRGGAFGILDTCATVAEFRDNVWDDTGEAIPRQ